MIAFLQFVLLLCFMTIQPYVVTRKAVFCDSSLKGHKFINNYAGTMFSDFSNSRYSSKTVNTPSYSHVLPRTPSYSYVLPRTPSYSLVLPRTPSYSHVLPRTPTYSLVLPRTPVLLSKGVRCFPLGRYPEEWKTAKIVTLNKLKSGIPRCDQTRPISLLATHSKLFEKLVLVRIRHWAESNKLVPEEQSGFRPGRNLSTRVLSIYQTVKNNMAGNIPTVAVYVDYQKAYDKVWHRGMIVKLFRLGISLAILKFIVSWLKNRRAYITVGDSKSKIFYTHIGLPQGSSLSPYLFVVYHCDLVAYLGAHSNHIFADDLSVLITPPINRELKPMIKFLEEEGMKICNNIAEYSRKWKQPINLSKTVIQIFHTQVQRPTVNIHMDGQKLEVVNKFKYLGFTWTDKMSLKPTIDEAVEKIQRTYVKLRWMKGGKTLSSEVLRKCFFAYSFPYFSWISPLFPFLPETQKEVLRRKLRNGIRLIYRCPFASATKLFEITKEIPLDDYVKRFIRKRLKHMEKSDLGRSLFYEDIFHWDTFQKRKNDHLGHFFRLRRVKRLKENHRSLLLDWMKFSIE